jgi:hypothetical protein
MSHSQDINVLVLNSIDSLMVDGAQRKTTQRKTPVSAMKPTKSAKPAGQPSAREQRAAKRLRASNTEATEDPAQTPPSPQEDTCNRTNTHPLHTISTTLPPKPIDQWPALQNPEDIPADMPRVPPDEIRQGLPKDLIVLRGHKGQHRILVPSCQRVALTKTEHETMIHVKGNRVNHELSRMYY